MEKLIEITLPSTESELKKEIEVKLKEWAEVQQAPASYALAETVLIITLVAGSTTVLANSLQIVNSLLELKARRKNENKETPVKVGPVGGQGRPLDTLSEMELRQMFGVHESKKNKEEEKTNE